jgi:hypothetical protein
MRDEAPRAQPVRRVARLVRTKQAVMELLKADAERRDPPHRQPWVIRLDGALCLWRLAPQLFKPWKRMTCVLDIRHVVGDLWAAANALCGEASQAGQHWVQHELTAMLRGRVGYVIDGLRQILTKQRLRTSVRQTLAKVITCLHNHRRWMPNDAYPAAGVPVGTGVGNRPAVPWSRTAWRATASGGASKGQRPCSRGALTKSHDHDLRDDWLFHARQVRRRLYGRQPTDRPTERWRRVT